MSNAPPLSAPAALAAARSGDLDRALAITDALLSANPNDANALQIRAMALHRLGRPAEALAVLVKADGLLPNQPPILNSLGILRREVGDLEGSRVALERAIRLAPGFVDAHQNLATTLAALGHRDAARAAFERAIALDPRHAKALGKYARFLEAGHELEAARSFAERALAVDPSDDLAAMALGDIEARQGDHEAVLRRVDAVLADRGVRSDTNRAILLGMRARALEKLGHYAESFQASADANRLLREQHAEYGRISGVFSPSTLDRLLSFAGATSADSWTRFDDLPADDPVFLLGFARSGTTLLDQILSTLPDVVVLEEKENLADAWLALVLDPSGLLRWPRLGRDEVLRFRAAYWDRVRRHANPARGLVIVDKMPLYTALLGLIYRVFPRAKIVFTLRDPRDVVLSCFQQVFGMNVAMYQLLDLGAAAALYDQVMRLGKLWREKLPLNLYVVRYEGVVADLRAEISPLLDFVGRRWSEDLLKFQETALRKTIRTPSAKQVIQPLYSSSVGKWRNYERELAPALPVLDKWVKEFGYEPK
jgi:tetratricopeptide (TPR) repeat protein